MSILRLFTRSLQQRAHESVRSLQGKEDPLCAYAHAHEGMPFLQDCGYKGLSPQQGQPMRNVFDLVIFY